MGDADTAADVDTDTATDTDVDTDTATDTDVDADTATDTDVDADTATDTDIDADTATDTDVDADTATDTDVDADTATDASTNKTHQEPDGDRGTDPDPLTQPQTKSVARADTDTRDDVSDERARAASTRLDLNPISDSNPTAGLGERPDLGTEASSPSIVRVDSTSDTSAVTGGDGGRDTADRPHVGSLPDTETADPQRGESESLVDSANVSDFIFIGDFDADDDSGFTVDLEHDRDTRSLPEAGSSEKDETGESRINDPFAQLQTSPTLDEDQDTPVRDREEVFSQLDANADSFSRLDAAGQTETDPFEKVDVDTIDPGAVWDGLGPDGEPESGDETQSVETAEDSDHVISKRQYCQQCPHFSGPPATVCEHSGTTIVSVVDPGKFRVRNCPMVEEDAEGADQIR